LLPFFSLPAFYRQGRAGIKKEAKFLLFEKIGYSIILPQKNKKINRKKNTRLKRRVNPKVFTFFFPLGQREKRKQLLLVDIPNNCNIPQNK
jgi:hypothetical protein